MTAPFRLYGAELSPYSVKVRSYLTFKNAAFEWLPRSNARQEEFGRYAKLPLIPLVVDANERVLQDSTPIIETLEAELDGQSIVPSDPAVAFLAALIEDYADEWLNKAMFHYRWSYPADQESAANRIAAMIFEGAPPEGAVDNVRTRMIGRLHYVGSSPESAPLIEASFTRAVSIFDRMLGKRPYLLGGRPSLADFGVAGQLAQLASDPTPGAVIRAQAPNVVKWLERMQKPQVEGEFASFADLKDDVAELLSVEIAGAYLPWMAANADAVARDAGGVSLELGGIPFTQKPQRYAAKALSELRRKRQAVTDEALADLLKQSGVDAFLLAVADDSEADAEGEEGEEE
ncbi:MAG TPA: glutathione S-transferase family protein [Vitreimonas sp.]|jgi:glutathione S-transferase|nr:glutathione S-transferase family protein [Vitreimonas sp.]